MFSSILYQSILSHRIRFFVISMYVIEPCLSYPIPFSICSVSPSNPITCSFCPHCAYLCTFSWCPISPYIYPLILYPLIITYHHLVFYPRHTSFCPVSEYHPTPARSILSHSAPSHLLNVSSCPVSSRFLVSQCPITSHPVTTWLWNIYCVSLLVSQPVSSLLLKHFFRWNIVGGYFLITSCFPSYPSPSLLLICLVYNPDVHVLRDFFLWSLLHVQ